MAALGAALRKRVQLAFGVLKHQQPYQAPLDFHLLTAKTVSTRCI